MTESKIPGCQYPEDEYKITLDSGKSDSKLYIIRTKRNKGKTDPSKDCIIPWMVENGIISVSLSDAQLCERCNSIVNLMLAQFSENKSISD